MIVPMKKVSLITLGDRKNETLEKLRRLGIVHIEITEGCGEKLGRLGEQIALLENALYTIEKSKNSCGKELTVSQVLSIAEEIIALSEEKKDCHSEKAALSAELERLKAWGDIDPDSINDLISNRLGVGFYEMPKRDYEALSDNVKTVRLNADKSGVKFLLVSGEDKTISALSAYKLILPTKSVVQMRQEIVSISARIEAIDGKTKVFIKG
ncbi:MAG: hypothetical protein J6V50_05190 [Clostridia bacterium]|nr:hypothetical protein [Clostridia bacterium]